MHLNFNLKKRGNPVSWLEDFKECCMVSIYSPFGALGGVFRVKSGAGFTTPVKPWTSVPFSGIIH